MIQDSWFWTLTIAIALFILMLIVMRVVIFAEKIATKIWDKMFNGLSKSF